MSNPLQTPNQAQHVVAAGKTKFSPEPPLPVLTGTRQSATATQAKGTPTKPDLGTPIVMFLGCLMLTGLFLYEMNRHAWKPGSKLIVIMPALAAFSLLACTIVTYLRWKKTSKIYTATWVLLEAHGAQGED